MLEMTDKQKALFDDLTTLQQEIALNSISGMNDIDSYKNSSGKAKTVTAMESGASEILRKPEVALFVDSMKAVAVNKAIMSRGEMMERLSSLARANMNDLVEWGDGDAEDQDGNKITQSVWAIKPSAMQSESAMASIAELTAGAQGLKVKQHSPLAAMKQLADLGGYNSAQKVEHDVNSVVTTIDITATPEEAARVYTEMMEGK